MKKNTILNLNKSKKNRLRLFEGFAGYGGASFALKKAGISFETIGYSEIDKFAIEFYENNFSNIENYGDITKIDPHVLPDFDFFTAGFPCQPFSSVGLGLGEDDIRGTLFYDILRICSVKRPTHILLENVKGLKSNRHGKTLSTIVNKLTKLGYDVIYKLINSKNYGIPQNRERLWIYAYQGVLPLQFDLDPPKKILKKTFKDFLDKNPEDFLFLSQPQIERLKELYGLDFIVNEPSCVDLYNKNIRSDGISITILEPHHNKMRIAHPPKNNKLIVRKYSVREQFRLMGFDKEVIDYGNQSYQQLSKMAANGWDINLVSMILREIFNQLNLDNLDNYSFFKKVKNVL